MRYCIKYQSTNKLVANPQFDDTYITEFKNIARIEVNAGSVTYHGNLNFVTGYYKEIGNYIFYRVHHNNSTPIYY